MFQAQIESVRWEFYLARNFDKAEVAPVARDLGALLLVVCSLLVHLHLVAGSDPDVAVLAVQLLTVEPVLTIVIVASTELCWDLVESLRVQHPLLLRPQLPWPPVPGPEVLIVTMGHQHVIETATSSLGPDLCVLESLGLHQVLCPLQVAHHAVLVVEGDVAFLTVQTSECFLVLPRIDHLRRMLDITRLRGVCS